MLVMFYIIDETNMLVLFLLTEDAHFGKSFTTVVPALWDIVYSWNNPCLMYDVITMKVGTLPHVKIIVKERYYNRFTVENPSQLAAIGLSLQSPEVVQVFPYSFPTDIYGLFLPDDALGTEYYAIFPQIKHAAAFYQLSVVSNSMHVIAKINVHREYDVSPLLTEIIMLLNLEPYVSSHDFDISGSRVVSNSTVAVFCCLVRENVPSILALPPVSTLGRSFTSLGVSWVFRAVVTANDTRLTVNESNNTNEISQFQVLDLTLSHVDEPTSSSRTTIISNHSILVILGRLPFDTMLMPPIEQYGRYLGSGFHLCCFSNVTCTYAISLGLGQQLQLDFLFHGTGNTTTDSIRIESGDTDWLNISHARVSVSLLAEYYAVHIIGSHRFAGFCEFDHFSYEVTLGYANRISKVRIRNARFLFLDVKITQNRGSILLLARLFERLDKIHKVSIVGKRLNNTTAYMTLLQTWHCQ